MTTAGNESQGPDRCRANLGCTKYHDGNSPTRTGSMQHCCCCNPCISVRPGWLNSPEIFNQCCRCAPRGIVMRWTPDADEACCEDIIEEVVLIDEGIGSSDQYPNVKYQNSMFDLTITLLLGRFEYDGCAWKVSIVDDATGYTLVDEVYVLDNEYVSCLSVPSGIVATMSGPFRGTHRCDGTLSLHNLDKAKLAYIDNGNRDFLTRADNFDYPDIEISQERFIELYPPCGDCTQVCSVLCLYGARHVGGSWQDHAEFYWFDDGERRGWSYTPIGGSTEYILLEEDDYGDCTFVFDFETGAEVFDPITPSKCGCGVVEQVTNPDLVIGFTIRCGFCSYWEFYCGTCRCVPTKLCMNVFYDRASETNLVLTWDDDIKGWDSYDSPFAIYLRRNDDGDCMFLPDVYPALPTDILPLLECGQEVIDGKLNQQTDSLSVAIEYVYPDSGDPLVIYFTMNQPSCGGGPCIVTPCGLDCLGDPKKLYADITMWNDPYEDEPGVVGSCSVDSLPLDYFNIDGVGCGYVGWFSFSCWNEAAGKYSYYTFKISFGYLNAGTGTGYVSWARWIDGLVNPMLIPSGVLEDGSTILNFESIPTKDDACDPLFADTGDVVIGLSDAPFCCPSITIQRMRIVITE